MIFNSIEFLYFLPVVLFLYYLLPHRPQNAMLLAASYFFYGWWDWRFLSLLAISTLVDWWVALAIDDAPNPRRRKTLLTLSMICNLGFLGFFKYFNFFVDSAVDLLTALGIPVVRWTLEIALPIGISFYTFQSMSYTIDVYRGELKARRNLLDFALMVAFFPQLVAGPIERAINLLPQIEAPRKVSSYQILSGCWLILVGYFKKVVVADAVAPYVRQMFENPSSLDPLMTVGALYLFALQIYGDFSGYSDIARGTARLMGVELMVNFRQPYFSKSIGEFWRRWHISLSTWLRDYVYVPLGGNRRGPRWTYANLIIVFLLAGFWHGAAWTYILFGLLHATYMLSERAVGIRSWHPYERDFFSDGVVPVLKRIFALVLTFHLFCFSMSLFHNSGLGVSFQIMGQALQAFTGGDTTNVQRFLFFGTIIFLYDAAQEWLKTDEPPALFLPAPIAGLIAALLLVLIFALGSEAQTFIYFQF